MCKRRLTVYATLVAEYVNKYAKNMYHVQNMQNSMQNKICRIISTIAKIRKTKGRKICFNKNTLTHAACESYI